VREGHSKKGEHLVRWWLTTDGREAMSGRRAVIIRHTLLRAAGHVNRCLPLPMGIGHSALARSPAEAMAPAPSTRDRWLAPVGHRPRTGFRRHSPGVRPRRSPGL